MEENHYFQDLVGINNQSINTNRDWKLSIFGKFDQKLSLLPSYSLICPPSPPSLVLQTVLLCQTKYSNSTLL